MTEAVFQYKCRRCGVVADNCVTSADHAQVEIISLQVTGRSRAAGPGGRMRLLDVHNCEDGGMGLSDLVGFSVEKEGG